MTRHDTPPRAARRAAAFLAAALVAALLPLVAVWASPAAAAADCLDETYEYTAPPPFNLLPVGCDDTVAPNTVLNARDPRPQLAGLHPVDRRSRSRSAASTPMATPVRSRYECQLYDTAVAPASWTACASPKTYTGLQDTLGHAVHVPRARRRRRRRGRRRV